MINPNKTKIKARKRRHLKVRSKIRGAEECPRLSVFRSLKHIYVQLIDDEKGKTLVAASDFELKKSKKKVKEEEKETKKLSTKAKAAYRVGQLIAQKAIEKGIEKIVFDRGGYRYHGRIKALADGARAGGLKF